MTARLLTTAGLLCGLAAPVLAATPAAQIVANPTSAAAAAAKPAAAAPAQAYAGPAASAASAAPAAVDANAAVATAPSATAAAAGDMPTVAAMTAPAAAPGQPQAIARPVQPMESPTAGTSAGNLLQTIFALLLVLGLLGGLAWFMKRYGPKVAGGSANLRMVGVLNLGGRERIMVVEVGDQWIVVGASPGRVNALATMPKQHTPEQGVATPQGTMAHGGFADWLKQTIDKRNAR